MRDLSSDSRTDKSLDSRTDKSLRKLSSLLCKELGYDVCIIPGTDIHQLETPLFPFRFRHCLSGFLGSAGTLLCTKKGQYCIFSDGRYATALLNQGLCFVASHEKDWSGLVEHVRNSMPRAKTVGICDYQCSIEDFNTIQKLAKKHSIPLQSFSHIELRKACLLYSARYRNYFTQKKAPRASELLTIPKELLKHGRSFQEKSSSFPLVKMIRHLRAAGLHSYFSSDLHEIAYLLGIRGFLPSLMLVPALLYLDIEMNILLWLPNSVATKRNLTLIDKQLAMQLSAKRYFFETRDYHLALQDLNKEIHDLAQKKKTILSLDRSLAPATLRNIKHKKILSPLKKWRSFYSKAQTRVFQQCLHTDCLALLKSMTKVQTILSGQERLHEHSVAKIIETERKKSTLYLQASFPSIIAAGPHSSIPHHDCSQKASLVHKEKPLLVDCGAHYRYATTDITRVFFFGETIPPMLREDYTLVLKAHIALLLRTHRATDTGKKLDSLGRATLLRHNRVFCHGIGHGVGFCSDVHDGIVSLSPSQKKNSIEGPVVLSNEPAFYRESIWGVRLENLVQGTQTKTKDIVFKNLTFFPFQNSLIDQSLLDTEEQLWLARYQRKSYSLYEKELNQSEKKFLFSLCAC